MLRKLITHVVENNLKEIASKSLINCHTKGLDSIMLIEKPEQTIRLFVARGEEHELWRNTPHDFTDGMSIGFHPHHCNVTLIPVYGHFSNWIVEECQTLGFGIDRYAYRSGISEAQIGFEFTKKVNVRTVSFNVPNLYTNPHSPPAVPMKASDIHTVAVQKGEDAAWLVLEGAENKDYRPVCYSNVDLENVDKDGLYEQPTADYVTCLLQRVGLLGAFRREGEAFRADEQ